jgi:hypothetical protein
MFGTDGFNTFEIEVHYDNPQGTSGVADSSGVRIYWTSQPREYQIGVLELGDPFVGLYGEPVGDGQSYHAFECPGSCSSIMGREVTVLREYLHMHASGARMTNEQIRDGAVLRKATVDYWEFMQNGNAIVQQNPYTVLPGDGFRTSCYYNGDGRKFGLGSDEEMCMAFVYYYPRSMIVIKEIDFEFPWTCGYALGYPPCETSYEGQLLKGVEDFLHEFGVPSGDTCDNEEDATDDSGSDVVDEPKDAAHSIISSMSTAAAFALSFLL